MGGHTGGIDNVENSNKDSVSCFCGLSREMFVVIQARRAASMGKVDIVLGQQCFVDRGVPPVTGKRECGHVGDHQGKNQAVPIATFSRSVSWSLGGAGRKRSRTEAAPATCSLKILCDTS